MGAGAVGALVPSDVGLMMRSRSISKLIAFIRVTKRYMIGNWHIRFTRQFRSRGRRFRLAAVLYSIWDKPIIIESGAV
jgi:hypothetical protein